MLALACVRFLSADGDGRGNEELKVMLACPITVFYE